jgi:hypothetical protein
MTDPAGSVREEAEAQVRDVLAAGDAVSSARVRCVSGGTTGGNASGGVGAAEGQWRALFDVELREGVSLVVVMDGRGFRGYDRSDIPKVIARGGDLGPPTSDEELLERLSDPQVAAGDSEVERAAETLHSLLQRRSTVYVDSFSDALFAKLSAVAADQAEDS